MKKTYGLIGRNIDYSFSRKYFSLKFDKEQITNCEYLNFDIEHINKFENIFNTNKRLSGFNVTIPYKEAILNKLDKIDATAKKIGAINTIKVESDTTLTGYNTDAYGFEKSLTPLLEEHHKKALILGTGGASKAIAYTLEKLGIPYKFVSRNKENTLTYDAINAEIIASHTIIINCTPLGTYPDIEKAPSLPYHNIGKNHLLYDLVYNPKETMFLKKGKQNGAKTINGEKMLILQAEKAWEIWNN